MAAEPGIRDSVHEGIDALRVVVGYQPGLEVVATLGDERRRRPNSASANREDAHVCSFGQCTANALRRRQLNSWAPRTMARADRNTKDASALTCGGMPRWAAPQM